MCVYIIINYPVFYVWLLSLSSFYRFTILYHESPLHFYKHMLILQRVFIVIFPYIHIMYFDQIYRYSFLSSFPLFKMILMGFISLFSYMCMKYFDHIHPPSHWVTLLPPIVSNFQTVPVLHSCHSSALGQIPLMRDSRRYLSFSVWLTSLNMMIYSFIHFPTNAIVHSCLWLNNTLLCLYTTLSLSMNWLMGI
jgi:hypothetical protein